LDQLGELLPAHDEKKEEVLFYFPFCQKKLVSWQKKALTRNDPRAFWQAVANPI